VLLLQLLYRSDRSGLERGEAVCDGVVDGAALRRALVRERVKYVRGSESICEHDSREM
jgi:hypothetical protein